MNKKTFLISAIIFMVVTHILYNVLNTAIGAYLMTISLLAFIALIIMFLYYIIKFCIQQFNYNQRNR